MSYFISNYKNPSDDGVLRWGSGLRSSLMLRSISWQLFIDVSRQYIYSIFKCLLDP